MFKVGDVVERTVESRWPDEFGEVGKRYVVLGTNLKGSIQIFPDGNYADYNSFIFVGKSENQLPLDFG